MRITDTDARSYRKKEFAKVLEQHEKEKKDKYLQNCLEMRKDFTPMVYSVDGIAGREARNAEKRLATHLAGKCNREYSQMVYYVRVRMAIEVVRANSLLIRFFQTVSFVNLFVKSHCHWAYHQRCHQ